MKLLLRVMTTKLSKMMKELSSDQPRGSSCVPCNSYIIMRPLVLVQCVLVYFSVLVSVKFFYCSEDSCNKPTRIFARFIHGRDFTELMHLLDSTVLSPCGVISIILLTWTESLVGIGGDCFPTRRCFVTLQAPRGCAFFV